MSTHPLILSLETATLGGSVWLGRERIEIASRLGDPRVSQSNSLLADINACIEQAGVSLENIDVFACASGPGSFTGLRIGIATLKGLAATLDRPCVGVHTLEAVAHAAGPSSATVSLLPAGRGEVFAQKFAVSTAADDFIVQPIDTAAHLKPPKLIERYAAIANLRWAGSGAHLHKEIIVQSALAQGITLTETPTLNAKFTLDGWQLAADEPNLARHVAALAAQAFRSGKMQSAESLRAFYVRPSDAELNELR